MRNIDRVLVAFGVSLAAMVFGGAVFAAIARGEQPVCTGDRHYDGVACCPAPETTTTTLVTEPRIGCPDPAPCPTVTCKDGATVVVDRCPDVVVPNYFRCNRDRRGNEHCPIKDHPHRFFKPMVH